MPSGRLVALLSVLALSLLLPSSVAAPPEPMTVSGTLLVNGAAPRAGTALSVRVAGSGDLATTTLLEGGAFSIQVPGDDPSTNGREGAVEGEPLEFHALGGRALAPVAFAAGGTRSGVSLATSLPDLAIVGVAAEPREVAEGDDVVVSGSVANRGRVGASVVRVVVSEGATTLGTQFVGDVPVNATAAFSLTVDTTGLGGERTLRVQAFATNGDADPATDVGTVGVVVEANAPPLVRDLRRVPIAPAPGETVALLLDAEDADGVARVEFLWTTGGETQRALVAAEPWQASLGAFPAGTSVRYWAVVTDASPLARATTTPAQTFEVRDAEDPRGATPETPPTAAAPTSASATPSTAPASPATPAGPSDTRGAPWPWLAGLAALASVAYLRRRST